MQINVTWRGTGFGQGYYEAKVLEYGWTAEASAGSPRRAVRNAKRKLKIARRAQGALAQAKGTATDRLAERVVQLERRVKEQGDLNAHLVAQAEDHRKMVEHALIECARITELQGVADCGLNYARQALHEVEMLRKTRASKV